MAETTLRPSQLVLPLFVREDAFGRFASCLVYIPRDRYNTAVRERIASILKTWKFRPEGEKYVGEVEVSFTLKNAVGQSAPGIVIDFTETTFIDSTTLGVLLGGMKRLTPEDGNVVLVCGNPNIRKIFEITLLDRVFSLHADRDAARAVANGGV